MFIYGFHLLVTYFINDILFTKLAEESDNSYNTYVYCNNFIFKKSGKSVNSIQMLRPLEEYFFLNCRTQNKKKAKMST